ncbi:MAG TPA: hypothetical protein VHP33_28735 [Polyangiaceae bacterium]|nr:hypothetical protein [Polyangiaceae bacterium]
MLVIALASLLGAVGCEQPMFDTSGSGSSGGMASAGGTLVISGASSVTPVGGEAALPPGCSEHLVDFPAGGAPALDDEICSATMEPVLASGAAYMRLVLTDDNPRLPAAGSLTFPEGLRGHVKGDPIISVDRTVPNLHGVISSVSETDEGYAFAVTFDPDALLLTNDQTRVSLRATFDYRCEGGSRLVNAVTELRLCGGFPTPPTWSGPGETCVVCYEFQPARPNP